MDKVPKQQIQARISVAIVDQLTDNARLRGVSLTDVLQTAIARYLEKPELEPITYKFAELERRILDIELIVRSRPKPK